MARKKSQISFRIPTTLRTALDEYVVKFNTSVTDVVTALIKDKVGK